MSRLELKIGAVRYEGWKSVSITRGIEQLAGCFDITCADRWAVQGLPLPKLRGESCSVLMDGVPVITGFIDDAPPSYSARGHELTVRGRDATGDLVDSCATSDGQGWQGRSLRQIAQALCQPFGIPVVVSAAAARDAALPFQHQHIQMGETIHEALARLARIRGLLLTSDGLGSLVITGAGTQRCSTPLVLGRNILEASAEASDRERFRTYRVVAQSRESDFDGPSTSQQVLAEATDLSVRAGRLLIIDPVDAADAGAARQLAAWKCALHSARGNRIDYTVRGWMDGKAPWMPNRLVTVEDAWARFSGEYLVSAVTSTFDDRGELSTLTVVPPDAYALLKTREVDPDAEASP